MMQLLVSRSPGEARVVRLRDGVAEEYYIHRPAAPDGLGDLIWARVIARVPAMAGAFVALPGAEGFLPDTEAAAGAGVGDHLVVRVTRAALGQKGPRVTARVADADRALGGAGTVRLLRPGPTPLEELCACFPEAEPIEGPFPDALEAELEALAEACMDLPGGMRASVVPTPALTAIDLDSARGTAARGAKPALQFAFNREALPELARQIRLRNLSGAILVDLCGMKAAKRSALAPAITAALESDRLAPRLAGFSSLGFAEILRPRLRPPLHERLAGPHAAGLAALRTIAREASRSPGARFVLRAAPSVHTALIGDGAALAEIARCLTYKLTLQADPGLPPTGWHTESAHG